MDGYGIHIIERDGKKYADFYGVNFGYSNGGCLLIKYEDDPYIIVHEKGTRDWSGRGETSYYPSSYTLYKLTTPHRVPPYRNTETIKEIEVGKKWKQSLNILIDLIKELKNASETKTKSK